MAIGAWIRDDLPATLAGLAGSLHGKKTRRLPHCARSLARRASLGRRAGFRPFAPANFAGHGRWHAYLRGFPQISLSEADFHIVAKVRAALRPRPLASSPAAAPAHEFAEQILEYVRHR